MREEFEKWVIEHSNGCVDLHVDLYGEYDDPVTVGYWRKWQAAWEEYHHDNH